MFSELMFDLTFIKNKYHDSTKDFDPFKRMEYHGWEGDSSTGLGDAEMTRGLEIYISSLTDKQHSLIKAKAFAYVLDNMRIGISEHDYFPLFYNWNRPLRKALTDKWKNSVKKSEFSEIYVNSNRKNGSIDFWLDYDHSVPDWRSLYSLGFTGILQRAENIKEKRQAASPLTEKEEAYYKSIEITYLAILRLLNRIKDYAKKQEGKKAKEIYLCLDTLTKGPPETTYETLMLIFVYWFISESIDVFQVRSLGSGLDSDLLPYYKKDLASGRYTREQLDSFIGYFMLQFSAIGNYWGQPLYLGGTNADGSCKINEVSYRITDLYDKLDIYNPKIQIKYSKKTPKDFLFKVFDMIRRGHSSFVFVCEDAIAKTMVKRGISPERIPECDIKGCYEYAVRAAEYATAPLYVNLAGPLCEAVYEAKENNSFRDIEEAYFTKLGSIISDGMKVCNELEPHLAEINPANMLSGTSEHSLTLAKDAYCDGAEFNTTAILINGFATTVDGMMAVKKLVFDSKECTISELQEQMKSNWSNGILRAKAIKLKEKYGCGNSEADSFAEKLSKFVLSFQGAPNSRGGCYKIEMHSARHFITFGKLTGATPDGRLCGEETSKNASPSPGADRNGVTAVILSALAVAPDEYWEGFCLDLMLHETAAKGEEGLQAMLSLLQTYSENGGASLQFNIFDVSTLEDAQQHPEKYRNLQIRICGWNALWNNIPRSEQDKYIERAKNLAN